MSILKSLFFTWAALLLSCCTSNLYIPTSENIATAQKNWPETDSSSIFKGYLLYRDKCGNCHYLYKPGKYPGEKWESVLPVMKEKAKLSEDEYEHIKIYLLALSKPH